MLETVTDTQDSVPAHRNDLPLGIDPVVRDDWHVVAASTAVSPGAVMPFRLLDTDVVVWRGQGGAVQVWGDRCPHRSVRLSYGSVVENTLVCSYHGMAYDQTGQCVQVPAHPDYVPPRQACTHSYRVEERYGLIFVCLGSPATAIAPFPEWGNPDYRFYTTGPHAIRSNGLRAIENFLDVAHFPFLHEGILGDRSKPEMLPYEASIGADGVHAKDIRVWQPDPYGTGAGSYVTYDYWAIRPFTAYLRKTSPSGECMTLLYTVTPVGEEECVSWMSGAMNYGHDLSDDEVKAFQTAIVLQDLRNLESHSPKRLPLEPAIEFHVPSDRTSLLYRKWLKQLGLTYGVL